jgi:hypothetical protein
MKYILFAGNKYDPNGGWKDCKGLFDTIHLAMLAVSAYNDSNPYYDTWDWWHVVNASSLVIEAEYEAY